MDPSAEFYILGDINIDYTNVNGSLFKKYAQVLNLFNCKQLIKEATRITDNTKTVLDHIVTNSKERVSYHGILNCSLSDHLPIFFTRGSVGTNFSKPIIKRVRSFKNYTRELFLGHLRSVDWTSVFLARHVDESLGQFVSLLHGVLDRVAPLRDIKVKQKTEPWFNGDIQAGIRRRDVLFKRFRKDRGNVELYREYCRMRNKVQRDVKLAKEFYFRGQIERNRNNSGKLWTQLKDLGYGGSRKSDGNIVLEDGGTKHFDVGTVAKVFNKFFTNVASDLVKMLPTPYNLFTSGSSVFRDFYRRRGVTENAFALSPVTRRDILKQLLSLEVGKSTGLDGISARFLRDGATVLADPIAHIVNLSITSATVPSSFKDARVRPLYKKGDKLDPGNYRPVSVLNVLSKILERTVHRQLMGYLEQRGILFGYQSGFRAGFSTDTCLVNLNDYVRSEISKGNFVGMVMIDLRKAFDTVDFDILLSKLKAMGVGSNDWFRSYLTGRRQCVNVSGTDSDFLEVSCGVPQGSILGPTLFLCYINDMSVSLDCRLSLYADDSTLISSGRSVESLSTFLTGQLESCSKWLVDNKLSLHVDKCESIIFGSCRKIVEREGFQVKCYGKVVPRVSCVKYLGVLLDENLAGDSQASAIVKKVSSRLAFLYRKSGFLDRRSRSTLCLALVQPIFDYCSSSWYSGLSAKFKKRLEGLQRKMIRFALGLEFRSEVNDNHLANLGWLSVPDRVRYFKLIHVFKIFKGLAPKYVAESFKTFASYHSYSTRGSQTNYLISKEDTVGSMLSSFSYTAKHEWNELPSVLKTISTLKVFKKKLREHISDSY